ncbi:Putative phage protein [Staphylococcus xylosus]|uniref:helix-turn-helix domain-containing protein n=1 Tax=Staphylococcus xylosus TaxID=1288 RepID=UPI0004F747E6|nr:helix-turn-helix domain-containing protein [Staphylococcus xylosus]CEF18827.1 Putative phage protein [Staphylococcus xylosus]
MVRVKMSDWTSEEKLLLIESWSKDGLTNEQIAHNMGVHRATLSKWQKQTDDINNALKRGKEVSDREVENTLFKNAVGFHYTEEQLTNTGEIVQVSKYHKPNTTAQIFWLKNRKPSVWRDKQNIKHGGNIENNVNHYANLSEAELKKLAGYD